MRNIVVGIAAVALAGGAGSSFAQETESPAPIVVPGQISHVTDGDLTCPQMADEAAGLSARMGQEGEQSLFGRLGGVARSGAEMLIPGAGLVMAGADVATQSSRDREAAEEAAIRYRWHFLNGMYLGRRCEPPGTMPTVVLRTPAQPLREAGSADAPVPTD